MRVNIVKVELLCFRILYKICSITKIKLKTTLQINPFSPVFLNTGTLSILGNLYCVT